MKLFSNLVALAFLVPVVMGGENPGLQLEPGNTISTHELAWGFALPLKCDLDGNLSLRVDREIGEGEVLLRISPDGKTLATISLDSIPEFAGHRIVDFAPGANGELYVLSESAAGEGNIVRFDSDGKYISRDKVDARIRVRQIAVFYSGDLLVGGTELKDPNVSKKPTASKPFIGIFTHRGQLRKRLELAKDVEPLDSKKRDRKYEEALAVSTMQSADDGNIYLMRYARAGPVYVISAAGEMVRRIQLRPPQGFDLSQIQVSRRSLLAEFIRKKPESNEIDVVLMQTIDPASGRETGEYWTADPQLGPLGCYTPGKMTFVSVDKEHHLTLVESKVH